MFYINKDGIPLGQFQSFAAQKGIAHFISTRAGGLSKGVFESLNLSLNVNDPYALRNRERLAGALGIASVQLKFPLQCHSDHIQLISSLGDATEEADALVTAWPGMAIAVLVADCAPVLFYDKKQRVIAAAHAGWRGTVKGIVSKTIRKMKDEFNSRPSDILVGVGPSISVEHYEVGEAVIEKVRETFGDNAGLLKEGNVAGKAYYDLWECNKLQAMEEGVPESRIELAGVCTFANTRLFFSARKLGQTSGRFAAGIMLT